MKKRILSVLCALCLIVSLLPTTAMAAGTSTAPEKIYICGMTLTDGKCLTDNEAASVSDYTDGAPYVALYKDGVLYLNGLNKTYAGQASGYRTLNWDYSSTGKHDLVIELVEGSVNTLVDTNYGAINGASGFSSGGPSLTIQGKGILNVTGGTYAIWVWESVTIQDGATVNAIGGTQSGISINNTGGAITVKQGTTVTTSGAYGISGSNGRTVNFNIEGGNLVVKGTTQALYNTSATIDSAIDVYVSGVTEPTQASDVTTWDRSANLVSTDYKYISLSGFSSTVTTYDVTTGTAANGTYTVGYTKSMANETVTITAIPNSGYEVDTVTVTDADSDSVTVSGEGNTRTFTMPAEDVAVAVTFKPTTYTVTLNANGGTVADGKNITSYTYGTDVTLPAAADMTKTGYTFGGWYTTDAPGDSDTAVTEISNTDIGNKIFYAQWTENQPAALESVTFGYAYDVQRNPAFPGGAGYTVTLSSLNKPLLAGGDGDDRKGTNEGTWTLTKIGTYSYVKSLGETISYASTVAEKYGVNADEIVVHQLKDGSDHIAYGVVIVYDTTNNYAVFIGNNISGSGAGYLLTTNATTGPVTATATMIATDFIPTCELALDTTGTYTFTDTSAKIVTASNSGTAATGALTVALSGTNADSFELSKTAITDIAAGGNDTFTVAPKSGLAAGTYTATVTVSGANVVSKSFNVTFTVNAITVTFDANGGSVTPTSNTTGADGKLASLPTPTRSGSYSFKGWHTAANGGTQITTDTVFTENTTIFAQWTYTGGSYHPATYAVVVEDADKGEVSASTTAAFQGTTVTIQVDPDKGYTLETLTATDRSGKEIELTKVSDSNYTFKMPASKVTVQATFMEDNTMLNFFVDVPADAYYYDAVLWAAKNGITTGTSATTFSPDMACTRAQMVAFLWRAVGSPEPTTTECPFTDVDLDSYYGKAVLWAVENGITKGTSTTTFSPDMACSRAQMVTFICRMADGKPVSSSIAFTDVTADAYYAESVQWAVENGITEGTGEGKYSPDAVCTRGQMVTFLYRYYN